MQRHNYYEIISIREFVFFKGVPDEHAIIYLFITLQVISTLPLFKLDELFVLLIT